MGKAEEVAGCPVNGAGFVAESRSQSQWSWPGSGVRRWPSERVVGRGGTGKPGRGGLVAELGHARVCGPTGRRLRSGGGALSIGFSQDG